MSHDGAFADRVFVPEENLHVVPINLSNDVAVFTEPLAAAFQIPAQVNLAKFRKAIVIGDGRLAFVISQVLRLHGCEILVVGKHESKLERLRQLGIPTQLLTDALRVREYDLAVDCAGSSTGIDTALQFLRPRGTLVLKTTVANTQEFAFAPLVIDEITVVGSRCGPFAPALQALANGDVVVEPLITGRYRLEQAVDAFEQAASGQQGKILFEIG